MTITATDIKLLESEVMSDATDGGGRKTSRVIPDGVAGNIFPKVSRLDSVYGRVNLRKIYGAVQTANVDTYAGAHAVITDAPDNAKIHTTLFSTSSDFDNRTNARDRIESYVTSGPESRMILFGRQLAGQQTFRAYQKASEPLLAVGDVYCISTESGATIIAQQYVRVQEIEHELRTFTDINGDFTFRILTINIGVPLRYDFVGPETPSRYSDVARSSKIRDTTVVDAARYFGIQPLAEGAAIGALDVSVASVYTPIVPTTQREAPLSQAKISETEALLAGSSQEAPVEVAYENHGWSVGESYYTQRGIEPGSLRIVNYYGGTLATDDAKGNVTGNYQGSTFTGTVDYATGRVIRTGGTESFSEHDFYYKPAAPAQQPAHTRSVEITLATRGTVYSQTLYPPPAPGTVIIDYRALGKWYRMRDDGAGKIAGVDAAYGVGSVDYQTGAVVITLGALPDVGGAVMFAWGSKLAFTARTNDADPAIRQIISVQNAPITKDTVSITYRANGVDYTATDNASGVISGGGLTGSVDYDLGKINLVYSTRLPDSATNVSVSYTEDVPVEMGEVVMRSASMPAGAAMPLGYPVSPGTLRGELPFVANVASAGLGVIHCAAVSIIDDGNGQVITKHSPYIKVSGIVENVGIAGGQVIGVINYATGDITISAGIAGSCSYLVDDVQDDAWAGGLKSAGAAFSLDTGQAANWVFKDSGVEVNTAVQTESFSFAESPLLIDLTRTVGEPIVEKSIMFTLGGKAYTDRNGSIYTDVSFLTGAGTNCGTVNYETGVVSLDSWTQNASPTVTVNSCLTVFGEFSTANFTFRTAGSPVRPASLYVQAISVNGDILAGTANTNGIIVGSQVDGTINTETGVVAVRFGEMVSAAGHETEFWFDEDDVVGGQIWKPTFVQPSTLAYNAVVLTNLPLNADILGLDPVRLPTDGRVPVFRPADVVVIHNIQTMTLENPVIAGKTYSAGRVDLAECWIEDSAGTKLAGNQYVTDLDAGTATIAADFVAGALIQPLKLKHRIEDMNLATDVQINGQIGLSAALPRAYPQEGSFVSSALLFGDLSARVTNTHDLSAFSTWSNTPGTGASAQFNNIDYPIEILNNGAVTERWRINFTSATAFQVIGENLGVIATGSTSADCSPSNQLTGQPYFVIRSAGWGAGWSAGNQLRFNTYGASAPIWIARTVLPGATLEGDQFSMQLRGDVDA